jgi:hypothetical protein
MTIDVAALLVAGYLLEQAPRALIISYDQLCEYYEPALQNFKDLNDKYFDPPTGFRVLVMDQVNWYLDLMAERRGL